MLGKIKPISGNIFCFIIAKLQISTLDLSVQQKISGLLYIRVVIWLVGWLFVVHRYSPDSS